MKISEAKEIVGYIIDWQFVLLGVKEREEAPEYIDLSKYSLSDLITANKLVKANNERKQSLEKYNRSKNRNVKGYSISMTMDDRLIAAIYTAISFPPNGDSVVLINDVCVGCVKAKYE